MDKPEKRSPWALLVHAVLAQYRLDAAGTDGPAHWLRVAENGRALAVMTPGADPIIVEHFALRHDACRQWDGADDGHGERAAARGV